MKAMHTKTSAKSVPFGFALGVGTAVVLLSIISGMVCKNVIPIEAEHICGKIVFYSTSLIILLTIQWATGSRMHSLIGYVLYGIMLIFAGWAFFNGDMKSSLGQVLGMIICIAVYISFELMSGGNKKRKIM